MKPELKIVNVDGKKTLVVNGRSLLNKQQVTDQIAALNEHIAEPVTLFDVSGLAGPEPERFPHRAARRSATQDGDKDAKS